MRWLIFYAERTSESRNAQRQVRTAQLHSFHLPSSAHLPDGIRWGWAGEFATLKIVGKQEKWMHKWEYERHPVKIRDGARLSVNSLRCVFWVAALSKSLGGADFPFWFPTEFKALSNLVGERSLDNMG